MAYTAHHSDLLEDPNSGLDGSEAAFEDSEEEVLSARGELPPTKWRPSDP